MAVNASSSDLRRRKLNVSEEKCGEMSSNAGLETLTQNTNSSEPKCNDKKLHSGTFWLTRVVFLRSLAFIYFVAFLVAFNQNKQLLGSKGLLPVSQFMNRVKSHYGGKLSFPVFDAVPTSLWLVDMNHIDFYLDALALAGISLSLVLMVSGCGNMVIMTLLWMFYHSIVNVGQRWYSFGWESQLLETGFLAIFMCPVLKLCKIPEMTPVSLVVIWGYRWLLFRIMFGAGMIKIRGDKCWRDLTCMNYHYQTQPVPNPVSYYLHQSPEIFHKFETLSNHFIELVVPFFLILPRRFQITCGCLQILFQVVLIVSGNLSFLNWLTILPSILCFDDKSLSWLFNTSSSVYKSVWSLQRKMREGSDWHFTQGFYIRRVMDVFLAILLAYLSIPVVQNLFSSRQIMNTSFNSLQIVNTYGAFGSITKQRTEIILQGTRNKTSYGKNVIWEEYEFKCKPGNVKQRPCLISPYHYRLDWLMWFAAFQNYQNNPWLLHLTAKLLVNDHEATTIIAFNPFENDDPPRFIRAEHYEYKFTRLGSEKAGAGYWWTRKKIASYFPAVSLKDLEHILENFGWSVI